MTKKSWIPDLAVLRLPEKTDFDDCDTAKLAVMVRKVKENESNRVLSGSRSRSDGIGGNFVVINSR